MPTEPHARRKCQGNATLRGLGIQPADDVQLVGEPWSNRTDVTVLEGKSLSGIRDTI
jgi:hypothetical protein